MNVLQQVLLTARTAGRRAISRLGSANPRRLRPARLVLRLHAVDLPDSLGERAAYSLAQWQARLVEAVQWLSPLPVTLLAGPSGDHPLLVELVRFANRLGCPTLLEVWGGIDEARALALIDAGLRAARVPVGGVSDPVHRSAVDGPLAEAQAAAQNLLRARRARSSDLDVEIALPWQGRANEESAAVLAWARRVGGDGFRLIAPWLATDLPADPEQLDRIAGADVPFNRTHPASIREMHAMVAHQDGEPGMSRRRSGRRCPVGGQRLELTARGRVYCCPFKPEIPVRETLAETWALSGGHLREIVSCKRACAHPELAPDPILLADGPMRV